jgi:outer membrane protein
MFKVNLLLVSFVFLSGITGQAQNKGWSLQACIDTAIQRNITVKQQQVTTNISKVNLDQSKDNLYPNLFVTDAPGFNFGKTQSLNGAYSTENTSTNAFAITSNVTLYNGLQNQNTIRENRFTYQAGMQEVEKLKNDVSLNVLMGYMQVLVDYEAVDIAESQMESIQTQVAQTKIYVQAGRFPELNLLQVESQLAADKLAKVNAQNQLILAKVNLMQLMNLPVNYNFDVDRPANIDSLLNPTALASGDIYITAAGFLPQVKNAELNTKASQSGVKVAQALYYPKLTMSGSIRTSGSSLIYDENYQPATIGYVQSSMEPVTGYSLEATSSNNFNNLWIQTNNNFNQFIGFNLSIPIFSNFSARNSVEIAKLNVENAKLNEESVKITLRQTIEQAYTNMFGAAEQYTASKEALQSEEESFRSMEQKFKIGLENATDYLIEKTNYTKAQQNVASAKYNYLLQLKLIDFYLGKPITF